MKTIWFVCFSSLLQVINMNDTVVIDSIIYSTEALKYVILDHKTSLKPNLYFCVGSVGSLYAVSCALIFVNINVQYTYGPLVCSVYRHVTGVTRSTTAKAEEEAARWRSIIAVTAPQRNRRRWHSFNLHKDVYIGRSTLLVADNNWCIMLCSIIND